MRLKQKGGSFVALILVLLLGMHSGMPTHAIYENTYTNTGDAIEDLIHIAETQLGYCPDEDEAGNKYNRWNGTIADSYDYAWCHTFVSWCADQAGIGTELIPKTQSVTAGKGFFNQKKRWMDSESQGGSYVPRRGDLVYFSQSGDPKAPTHVGIVTEASDDTLYTIEGNVSNLTMAQSYPLSSETILGYGCPLYDGYPNLIMPSLIEEVEVKEGSSIDPTEISWTKSQNATDYSLKIWDAVTGGEVTSVESTGGICFAQIQLDAGTYEVQVCAMNGENIADSPRVQFSIYHYPDVVELHMEVGTADTPTTFFWEPTANTVGYSLNILAVSPTYQETFTVYDDCSYSIQLEPGMYFVYVTSFNQALTTKSELIKVTIPQKNKFLGDLNMDGSCTIDDASLLQPYLLGMDNFDFTQDQFTLADLNQDGVVNGIDLTLLRQILLAQET